MCGVCVCTCSVVSIVQLCVYLCAYMCLYLGVCACVCEYVSAKYMCGRYVCVCDYNFNPFAPSRFEDFIRIVVLKSRGALGSNAIEYDTVSGRGRKRFRSGGEDTCFHFNPQVTISANSRVIKVPYQMLINGRFVDSVEGKTYETVNPTTEEVCEWEWLRVRGGAFRWVHACVRPEFF